jgi:hypothetical protein
MIFPLKPEITSLPGSRGSHNEAHRTIFPGQEEFTIVGRVMKAVRDL